MSASEASPNRAFTLRAVVVGLACGLLLALIATWRGTSFTTINFHMPPVVSVVLFLLAAGINPWLGRWRLRRGELGVVAIILLGACGVVGNGLARQWPGLVVGTAPSLEQHTRLEVLWEEGDGDRPGRWQVPADWFLAVPPHGPIASNDPEFRSLVQGLSAGLPREAEPRVIHRACVSWIDAEGRRHEDQLARGGDTAAAAGPGILDLEDPATGRPLRGLRAGERAGGAEVVAVANPAVPWDAWVPVALAWAPLIACGLVMMVALAGCVRRQWADHERLGYPIAQATLMLIDDPRPGRRWSEVYRSPAFQTAFVVTTLALGWQGLYAFGFVPFDIKTSWNLWPVFGGEPWTLMPETHRVFTPTIWPSIVAIAFLLTAEIGFSIWAFFLLTQFGFLVLNLGGIPATGQHLKDATTGGFFAFALWILWIGRHHYLAIARSMVGRSASPAALSARPYAWALVLSALGVGLFMVAHGAPLLLALATVMGLLVVMLILARLVAEVGMPFVDVPFASLNQVLLPIFGAGLGAGALVPAAAVAHLLSTGQREHLVPYAVNAEEIGERSGHPQRRVSLLVLGSAALLVVVAVGSYLYHAYAGGGLWRQGPMSSSEKGILLPSVEAAGGVAEVPWRAYLTGAVITLVLGSLRSRIPGWPLHPVGFVMCATFAVTRCWFAYLLGWLAKVLVMRYGGPALYVKLKPAVIGIIAGEALVAIIFLVVKFAWYLGGREIPYFLTLP